MLSAREFSPLLQTLADTLGELPNASSGGEHFESPKLSLMT